MFADIQMELSIMQWLHKSGSQVEIVDIWVYINIEMVSAILRIENKNRRKPNGCAEKDKHISGKWAASSSTLLSYVPSLYDLSLS